MSRRGLHDPENIAYIVLGVFGAVVGVYTLLVEDSLLLFALLGIAAVALGGYSFKRLRTKD